LITGNDAKGDQMWINGNDDMCSEDSDLGMIIAQKTFILGKRQFSFTFVTVKYDGIYNGNVTNDFWLYEKDRMVVGYTYAAGGSKCDDS
jgi:hypothetical protein